jgi:hypothetical protein
VIEPTPEMADLFEQARRAYWVALDHTAEGMTVREHHRVATLQALAAVLAIVERDYVVLCGAVRPLDDRYGAPTCNRRLGHDGDHRKRDVPLRPAR